MNYLEWNRRLYDFYFDKNNPVVYLSITRDKLAEIGEFTDKESAFEDFKSEIVNFPCTDDEKRKFNFLTHKIGTRERGYTEPSSMLRRAHNFKVAWHRFKQHPSEFIVNLNQGHPPYIAYLTALVLSIIDIKDEGRGFWGDFESSFGKKGTNYGQYLMALLEDLKRHDKRYDYFSVYPKNIYEGTIYSQMPLTEKELDSIRLFFVSKSISYEDLQNYSDEDLRRLLLDDLDENFANKLTIEALHDNSSEYDHFRIALPGIVKKLIRNYDLKDETLQKELDKKITDKESNRKYPFLLCFPFSKHVDTYYPNFTSGKMMLLVLNHGSKSDILDESETEITFKVSDTEYKIKINPEGKFSRPTNPINMDWDKQYHITKKGLCFKDNKRDSDLIIFVPSHTVGATPGYFIEAPNNMIPQNEPCIIYWKANSNENVAQFLDNCETKEYFNDHLKIGNWCGAYFKRPKSSTQNYFIDKDQKIILTGGIKTNPYGNEYFGFALPEVNFVNVDRCIGIYSENDELLNEVTYENVNDLLNGLIKNNETIIIRPVGEKIPARQIKIINRLYINPEEYAERFPVNFANVPSITNGNNFFRNGVQLVKVVINNNEYEPGEPNFDVFIAQNQYSSNLISEQLLYVLSQRRKFTINQFKGIVASFGELENCNAYTILNKLIEFGYVQKLNEAENKYQVIKPSLVHLPSCQNYMMLTGARSPGYINDLLNSLVADNIEYEMYLTNEVFLPQVILLKVRNRNMNQFNYSFIERFWHNDIGRRLLNSIPNFKNIELGTGFNQLANETNATLEKFNPDTLKFETAKINNANEERMLSLYRFNYKRSYKPKKVYFIKKEGNFHRLESSDQQEALYLYKAHTLNAFSGWIYYDKQHKLLAIPIQLSLPQEAQTALVLSGCFSKVVKVKPESSSVYKPQLTDGKMQLSAEGDSYLSMTVYTNVQDYIYEVLKVKLNKPFNSLNLSNLLQQTT